MLLPSQLCLIKARSRRLPPPLPKQTSSSSLARLLVKVVHHNQPLTQKRLRSASHPLTQRTRQLEEEPQHQAQKSLPYLGRHRRQHPLPRLRRRTSSVAHLKRRMERIMLQQGTTCLEILEEAKILGSPLCQLLHPSLRLISRPTLQPLHRLQAALAYSPTSDRRRTTQLHFLIAQLSLVLRQKRRTPKLMPCLQNPHSALLDRLQKSRRLMLQSHRVLVQHQQLLLLPLLLEPLPPSPQNHQLHNPFSVLPLRNLLKLLQRKLLQQQGLLVHSEPPQQVQLQLLSHG